jgi:hypothetical protein
VNSEQVLYRFRPDKMEPPRNESGSPPPDLYAHVAAPLQAFLEEYFRGRALPPTTKSALLDRLRFDQFFTIEELIKAAKQGLLSEYPVALVAKLMLEESSTSQGTLKPF